MSRDPVTQSMLGRGAEKAPPFTVDNNPGKPEIDILNLEQYTDDALRQVLIELRVRDERIDQEMNSLQNSILEFKSELRHLQSRKTFYHDIRDLLLSHLKGKESCRTNRSNTPPSQN